MKKIALERITLPVEGMTCASCVARVEKALSNFPGISNANVNLATEKASFEYDPTITDLLNLSNKIEDLGYKIDISFHNKPDTNSNSDKYTLELKNELIFAVILTIPIAIINMGMMWENFPINNILSTEQINRMLLVLTTPVIFISGRRFFKIFWNNLKHFTADMNSLVAIGTGSAYIYSLIITLFPEIFIHSHKAHVYFDTTAVIISLILLGRWLEARAKSRSGNAIKRLIELQPKTAIVKELNQQKEKKIEDLKIGDIVIVKPGAKIPADGIIINGSSSIDESMVTGESITVEKYAGSTVIGGTINKSGYFEFEITNIGSNSVLGQIIKLVEDAQGSKAPIQNLADKVAAIFVPIVVMIAIITFSGWIIFSSGDLGKPLMNFIAVLIIACPCALGLATPTALIVGMGKAAQNGILFKNGESLESLCRADTIVFDKTGTITEGKLSVINYFFSGVEEENFFTVLYSIEKKSDHPVAKAIIDFLSPKKLSEINIEQFEDKPGKGINGFYNNKIVLAGNELFMSENKIDLSNIKINLKQLYKNNSTIIFLAVDGNAIGFVMIEDMIKSNSTDVVREIKQLSIKPFLLSGDNEIVTKHIAQLAGITDYKASVLPEFKSKTIANLQSEGRKVIMVGDGINDAPALAQSDVGIAIGSGTDVAIESAGVVLISGDLAGVVKSVKLSKKTITIIKQNLFWAFIYNIIGIPLSALGLLNPMIAAFAMSLSSVSVISNSLRLKNYKL